MATKSIFKDVTIKDNRTARSLASALENAGNFQGREVVLQKKKQEITGDRIKEIFDKK